MAGAIAYTLLPVSALPEVDFPTIFVSGGVPGASPRVMAASVATPLEKQFTRIAGVTEMTSRSSVGSAMITLQFDLSRDINGAAREVQAKLGKVRGFRGEQIVRAQVIGPLGHTALLQVLRCGTQERGRRTEQATDDALILRRMGADRDIPRPRA